MFFEELDKELGKEHIFKKSILMIKAWCLYEGHILGSHIGCFSTYALEVLILFVDPAIVVVFDRSRPCEYTVVALSALSNWNRSARANACFLASRPASPKNGGWLKKSSLA